MIPVLIGFGVVGLIGVIAAALRHQDAPARKDKAKASDSGGGWWAGDGAGDCGDGGGGGCD